MLSLTACSSKPSDDRPELLVAAAASLKEVMTDIGAAFETHHGAKISFNFAGSNLLQRQIETGAPVDIFASAATVQMDALAGQNLIIQKTRITFATNIVVLVTPQDSPYVIRSFEDLTDDRVARIGIGSEGVPIRLYSEEILRHIGLWDTLSLKFIFGGHTRQVLAYVARGETDAGLVYQTDATLRPMVRVVAGADSSWHRPIIYPIAVLTDSPQQDIARQFIAFVMSDTGQEIVRRHGFKNVD
jgi:molybdate transport system substrate-binding protein